MIRYRFTLALLMNVPMSIGLTLAATLLNMAAGQGGFAFPETVIGLLLAYASGTLTAFLVPAPRWGAGLARRLGAGRLLSRYLPSLFAAVVNTLVISLVMTLYHVGILAGGGAKALLLAFFRPLLPLIAVAFLLATAVSRPAEWLTRRIVGAGRSDAEREENASREEELS